MTAEIVQISDYQKPRFGTEGRGEVKPENATTAPADGSGIDGMQFPNFVAPTDDPA